MARAQSSGAYPPTGDTSRERPEATWTDRPGVSGTAQAEFELCITSAIRWPCCKVQSWVLERDAHVDGPAGRDTGRPAEQDAVEEGVEHGEEHGVGR